VLSYFEDFAKKIRSISLISAIDIWNAIQDSTSWIAAINGIAARKIDLNSADNLHEGQHCN
jgi:hypothetical protein